MLCWCHKARTEGRRQGLKSGCPATSQHTDPSVTTCLPAFLSSEEELICTDRTLGQQKILESSRANPCMDVGNHRCFPHGALCCSKIYTVPLELCKASVPSVLRGFQKTLTDLITGFKKLEFV